MDKINELIAWYTAASATATVIAVQLFLIGRAVAKYLGPIVKATSNTWDDGVLAQFHEFLTSVQKLAEFIGLVIPEDKDEPTPPSGLNVFGQRMVPDRMTASMMGDHSLSQGISPLVSTDRPRPLLRLFVRGVAVRNGIDISKISDSDIDDALIRLASEERRPIRELFTWLVNNPDVVLAFIKLLLSFAADKEQQNKEQPK